MKLYSILKYDILFDVDYSLENEKILLDILKSIDGFYGVTLSFSRFRFSTKTSKTLYFLTRCIDNRYSDSLWILETYSTDNYVDGVYPIRYVLKHTEITCIEHIAKGVIDNDFEKLIDNMLYHLNDKQFFKIFDFTYADFNTISTKSYVRKTKLNKIIKP